MRFLSETKVLACHELRREGARRWLRLEIAGLGAASPGDTVLFSEDGHSPRCRIATVDRFSGGRATLVAKFEADDLAPAAGDGLTVWSNENPAVSVGAGSLIVTTPAFLYRIAPFEQCGAEVFVEDAGMDLWQDLRRRVESGLAWSSVFLALEPVRLQAFAAEFPDANPYLFANMEMSCGIGACRSCHVTVSDNKDGEASCRVGPWFALQRVNLVRLQFASAPFI
ncbi:hypothetical protein PWG15_23095 (plasmid) [Ensifer adhaerens]|uniref:iron-sulfur cluster-binding protein n=1 Tax=Ensifer adhaerens TaxID=106592 RepID=UPI0023AA0682|nr:hypothetical protein [Ensifer adhaerens]WDZ80660.1 hypothetical protein PWG15_23095 [Ensifer adhaerens]